MAIAPEDTGTRAADVLARVEEENVEFIRFWFTDIFGQLKSFAVGREELAGALEDGMGFDGSSITGFNRIEESDMIAMPDPTTFRILPWRTGETHKVGRVFCDVLVPGGEPYEGDPRFVMRRAIARAKEMGYDHYYLGPELEFFLFKSDEAPEILDKGGYFDLTTLDVGSDFRRDAVFTLRELGIPVEYTHHEVGPSQHEIDMRFADGLQMADNTMTYRIAVKEVAMAHGYYATFMPKPLFGENGSGMHTHQSLFRGDQNAFFDPDDEYFLSTEAKGFIAGLLRHSREICCVFAQWVNSYKRLVLGYEAPVYNAWSRRNRSALVRVPVYHPGKERATRAEFRCPDPACNPYLTFAAMLMAGLDGIRNKLDPGDPVDKNIYDLPPEEAAEIKQVPGSLDQALAALEADHEFLLEGDVFTADLISTYIDYKRSSEV